MTKIILIISTNLLIFNLYSQKSTDLFSDVSNKRKINKSGCFFYKTGKQINKDNLLFKEYVLGNVEDSIIAYWTYRNDTILILPSIYIKYNNFKSFPFSIINKNETSYSYNEYFEDTRIYLETIDGYTKQKKSNFSTIYEL